MKPLSRVYHSHDKWEEIPAGMWSDVDDRKAMLQRAIDFTGDHALYGSYMMRVIREWPISCENALTDQALNKRAWVGHAACAMAIGCPEDITRQAWGMLSDEQRLLANKEADGALRAWEHAYRKDRGLHEEVGGALLL
jgi:hypothetical protein